MQRKLPSIIPFLWLTSTYQAFGPYTMTKRIPFSNVARFKPILHKDTVSDIELPYSSKPALALLSNMVDDIVQLVVM